jgi:hypothetical protein
MKRALPCLIGAVMMASTGAWAQEAIPTAANATGGGAPPAPAAGAYPTMIADRDNEHDDRGPVPVGPCGSPYKSVNGGPLKQDKDPHGEVWAGVGTHGYRDVGGAVCVPVGKNAQVTIAVDSTQWGRR